LEPVGHYSVQTGQPEDGRVASTGYFDAVVKDGVVYVSSAEDGLVVLGYGCNGILPNPSLTSTG
jgi:hypothetical protein